MTLPTRKELRNFGLVMAVALGLLGLLIIYKHGWPITRGAATAWIMAGAFLLTGLAAPAILRWPHWAWMKFGAGLSVLTTHLVLTLIYLLLFTPLALFMRLIGRDPLTRRWEKEKPSYWITREKTGQEKAEYRRQF